ncbi:MAG: hypothetical protein H7122_11265 [Chitinophagaceae bacterium]|nr:hypothetical protein [Chitinophagaceae bacterium]
MKVITLVIMSCFFQAQLSHGQFGNWSMSANGFPVYNYTGTIPVTAFDKDGKDANLPEDPYFLLGNYRMTLITHVSGIYQFLTAERAWARINASEQTNYGWNDASLVFKNGKLDKKVTLTGMQSIAADTALVKKDFGVGFARYRYGLDNGIACTRIISAKPSSKINTGNPSFVITVILKNNGAKTQELSYHERVLVNYVLNGAQYTDKRKQPLLYRSQISIDNSREVAIADLSFKNNSFLVLPKKTERFMYDVDPPSVFMYSKATGNNYKTIVKANGDTLLTETATSIKPGEAISFNITVGLTEDNNFTAARNEVADLFAGADLKNPTGGLFMAQWKGRLPDMSSEKNEILRREMLWNAHFVEASAKYSSYYKETIIPQGTVYSYYFGDNISNRDHLQAALPACYTNPELAKSILRYVIKHAENDGEIKRGNSGFGYTPPSLYKESDEQLYFFNTLAEYLLITKDYSFLNEEIACYPAEDGRRESMITMLKKFFIYLRDEIGTGPVGLVKILNSDWSDSFFHEYSPNKYSRSAESHLNSAMVLAVFPKLVQVLKDSKHPEAAPFISALEEYRAALHNVFMNDLGNRKFAARAYLNNKLRFGVDNVCIEPQGYLLQIPDLSNERKREIYDHVKSKLLAQEKIGMRTREKPLWRGNPDGEDGGIWFSLEYPVLLGVATFDKEEARSLLLQFSFQNFTTHYPEYWVGQWTAADEVNSTLYREGLYAFWVPSQDRKRAFQGFCSHPHTWPLFCYYKLKE